MDSSISIQNTAQQDVPADWPDPSLFPPSHEWQLGSQSKGKAAVILIINHGRPDELRLTLCPADAAHLGTQLIAESERAKFVIAPAQASESVR